MTAAKETQPHFKATLCNFGGDPLLRKTKLDEHSYVTKKRQFEQNIFYGDDVL